MTRAAELRRAGQISKAIGERGLTPYLESRFFQAVYASRDWVLDGEPCYVAEYADGSILVYYPDREQRASRVLQSRAHQQGARDFLRGEICRLRQQSSAA